MALEVPRVALQTVANKNSNSGLKRFQLSFDTRDLFVDALKLRLVRACILTDTLFCDDSKLERFPVGA